MVPTPLAVGIDLDTTYSCVGAMKNDAAQIIANDLTNLELREATKEVENKSIESFALLIKRVERIVEETALRGWTDAEEHLQSNENHLKQEDPSTGAGLINTIRANRFQLLRNLVKHCQKRWDLNSLLPEKMAPKFAEGLLNFVTEVTEELSVSQSAANTDLAKNERKCIQRIQAPREMHEDAEKCILGRLGTELDGLVEDVPLQKSEADKQEIEKPQERFRLKLEVREKLLSSFVMETGKFAKWITDVVERGEKKLDLHEGGDDCRHAQKARRKTTTKNIYPKWNAKKDVDSLLRVCFVEANHDFFKNLMAKSVESVISNSDVNIPAFSRQKEEKMDMKEQLQPKHAVKKHDCSKTPTTSDKYLTVMGDGFALMADANVHARAEILGPFHEPSQSTRGSHSCHDGDGNFASDDSFQLESRSVSTTEPADMVPNEKFDVSEVRQGQCHGGVGETKQFGKSSKVKFDKFEQLLLVYKIGAFVLMVLILLLVLSHPTVFPDNMLQTPHGKNQGPTSHVKEDDTCYSDVFKNVETPPQLTFRSKNKNRKLRKNETSPSHYLLVRDLDRALFYFKQQICAFIKKQRVTLSLWSALVVSVVAMCCATWLNPFWFCQLNDRHVDWENEDLIAQPHEELIDNDSVAGSEVEGIIDDASTSVNLSLLGSFTSFIGNSLVKEIFHFLRSLCTRKQEVGRPFVLRILFRVIAFCVLVLWMPVLYLCGSNVAAFSRGRAQEPGVYNLVQQTLREMKAHNQEGKYAECIEEFQTLGRQMYNCVPDLWMILNSNSYPQQDRHGVEIPHGCSFRITELDYEALYKIRFEARIAFVMEGRLIEWMEHVVKTQEVASTKGEKNQAEELGSSIPLTRGEQEEQHSLWRKIFSHGPQGLMHKNSELAECYCQALQAIMFFLFRKTESRNGREVLMKNIAIQDQKELERKVNHQLDRKAKKELELQNWNNAGLNIELSLQTEEMYKLRARNVERSEEFFRLISTNGHQELQDVIEILSQHKPFTEAQLKRLERLKDSLDIFENSTDIFNRQILKAAEYAASISDSISRDFNQFLGIQFFKRRGDRPILPGLGRLNWGLPDSFRIRKDLLAHVKRFATDELQADRQIVLKAVEEIGMALQFASGELRGDRQIVQTAVKKDGLALRYASKGLQGDQDIVLKAVNQNVGALRYASKELRGDQDIVLKAVNQNFRGLRYASKELQADREIVLEAVKQNGEALQFASEQLRADREIVLEAVKQSCWALEFASKELQADREIVLEAVKQNGVALQDASEGLRGDREIVLEAVKHNGKALEFAAEDLRGEQQFDLFDGSLDLALQITNREIVLEAVKQNGWALEFASEELRGYREIVLEAVKQNGLALQDASEGLRGDREIVLEAVKHNGKALEFAAEDLRGEQQFDLFDGSLDLALQITNREIVLEAVKQNGWALEFASEELRGYREIVLEAVKQDGKVFRHASVDLQGDRETVLEAIKQNAGAIEYASLKLRDDKKVVMAAVKRSRHGEALGYASVRLRADPAIVSEAVKQNGSALKHASENLRNDRGTVLEAVATGPRNHVVPGVRPVLRYASVELQRKLRNKKIVRKLVRYRTRK